jgi:hypothetical protein
MILNMVKGGNPMGWAESKKDAANRGGFVSLKKDGESIDLVELTEPVVVEKPGFKGGEARTVYRVIVAATPVSLASRPLNLDLGIFAFNTYAAEVGEGQECKVSFKITRHGKPNDTDTRYGFKLLRKLEAKQAATCRKLAAESAGF